MSRSSCWKIYIYILRIVEYVPCPVFEPGGRLEFHQRRETIRSSKGCQCFHGSRNRYGREGEKKTRGERLLCLIRESVVRVVNPFCDAKVGPSKTGPSRLLQPSIPPTFSLFQIFFFLLFFSFDPPSSPFSVLSLSRFFSFSRWSVGFPAPFCLVDCEKRLSVAARAPDASRILNSQDGA